MPETAAPAGGASLESVVSSPSLTSVIGEMYGDFSDASGDEPETTETTDAGASPADASPSPDTDPAGRASAPSDPATAEPAGAPPAEAAAAPTDPSAASSTPETDPLEGATPLGYVVNGESRSFDGITVLKDGGAIVDPEALEKVQRVFGERDHLYERSREQHQQVEALTKLTEWRITDPATGQQTVVSGAQGIEAQRVALATLGAEVKAFRDLFANPENLRDVLAANEDGSLAWNPLGMKAFNTALENAQLRYVQQAKAHLATSAQPAPAAPAAPFDPQTLAPGATEHVIASLKATTLTPQDKASLAAVAPRFIRLATAQDQQANPALVVGKPMVEQAFIDMVKERADIRASTQRTVSTASDVAKANQAKLAQATVGKKPGATPARAATRQAPTEAEPDAFDTAWERAEKAAAGALRFRQTAG